MLLLLLLIEEFAKGGEQTAVGFVNNFHFVQ
jgi:hypothetical protein